MIICMRTTLVLDTDLAKRAKLRAHTDNTTLSEVVNRALRELLQRQTLTVARFDMVVFGGEQPTVHHEPGDFDAVAENDSVDGLRSKSC